MKNSETRMHSSEIRTARLLSVSLHALHRGCLTGGVSAQEGVYPGGCVCPKEGGVCPRGVCPKGLYPACNGADPLPPWTDRHL